MLIVLTFHGWKAHCEHDYEIYSGAFLGRNMPKITKTNLVQVDYE